MAQYLEKDILSRLKKQVCDQQHCLSDNQDNVELIVFNSNCAKRVGLMCSECFVDSELLKQLQPVEKYCLPIRKYLKILINFHLQYEKLKQSCDWGPTVLSNAADSVKKKAEIFKNDCLKYALQIMQYVDSITKKSSQDLRKIYQDADLNKLVQFLNEQNDQQQQRMILTNELIHVCNKIKLVDGKHKYGTEEKIKKQADEVVICYKENIGKATDALKQLIEVHKQCLKTIIQ